MIRRRTLFERCKLESAHKRQQLLVRGLLAELPICLGSIPDILALEVHCLHDRIRDILDANLLIFAHYIYITRNLYENELSHDF